MSQRHRDRSDGGPLGDDAVEVDGQSLSEARLAARRALVLLCALPVVWLVLTKSLPAALASISPEWALWLNARHPAALNAQATKLRKDMLDIETRMAALKAAGAEGGKEGGAAPAGEGRPEKGVPDAAPTDAASSDGTRPPGASKTVVDLQFLDAERARLRGVIVGLAQRSIDADPLNPRPYRLLGELAPTVDEARAFMQASHALSRRETGAVFWLLVDAAARKDEPAMIDYADKVLRVEPALVPYIASYVSQAAATERGKGVAVDRLAQGPKWRIAYFQAAARRPEERRTALDLLVALKDTPHPPSAIEAGIVFSALISAGDVEAAHEAWLVMSGRTGARDPNQLFNAGFDADFSGVPFDWSVSRATGALVAQAERDGAAGGKVLSLAFDGTRATFPQVRQILVLAPGPYQLTGQFKAALVAKRGIRWRVLCLYGDRHVLGETEILGDTAGEWRPFATTFEVVDLPDCRAQQFLLMHDARTSSEQVLSGEIVFDDLVLRRVE